MRDKILSKARSQSIQLTAGAKTKEQPKAKTKHASAPTASKPASPKLFFSPPQELDKMLYMVKVVGGFLNLYIHRKTLSHKDNPPLEPYGLANLMMFHPDQIWLAVSQYITDEQGVYLDAYAIDDLPVEAIFQAIFVFAQGIINLDIVNMWSAYCKGFNEDMALHIMEDISQLSSLEKLMANNPSQGLAFFLGEVLKNTALQAITK